MNGADTLIQSFVQAGVNVCFANPGTSEMHLVQSIDAEPGMRAILALFEGVCTGAADGYGRMTGMPATTLLHLGPGFANGIANLHNARRASSPIINLVGNHATWHVGHDAPLTSDIDTLARNVSSWIKSDSSAASLAADGMGALQAALTAKPGSQGQISTMIIPAEACWQDASTIASAPARPVRPVVDESVIRGIATQLEAGSLLLLDGHALTEEGIRAANQIATATGCQVLASTFPARIDGGPGKAMINRLPYFPEHVLAVTRGLKKLVLAGAAVPVSFFAYPDTPSVLIPDDCEVHTLARGEEDVTGALQALAEHVNATGLEYATNPYNRPEMPANGKLTTAAAAAVIGHLLPENAIICGDSGGGGAVFAPAQTSAPHSWLNLTGGSIGQGGPLSVGAAVACPESRVMALLGDGAFMYTNQYLWTQARENLNVTSVVFNNGRYGILETEYLRLGVNAIGERAGQLFDLGKPAVSYASVAASMGVEAVKVDTTEGFAAALARSYSQPGPFLIEAVV